VDSFDPETWRAEQQAAFEARYARLRDDLDREGFIDADVVMEYLFRRDCLCACHPSLGSHDHSPLGCPCEQTPEQRRAASEEWQRELEAWWASDEYQESVAADEAALNHAKTWGDTHGVVAQRHTCFAPEQWTGTVDGVPFYFRERHGSWRLEAPATMIERGPTVAEGSDGDYANPTELISLIARSIRLHVRRQHCHHTDARTFCPHCGQLVDIDSITGGTSP
jgi:hypothetical protein